MTRLRRLADDEAGMTLIEMMIAISLLGIIVGPIVFSMLLSLLETNSTRDRIADSAAAQVLSAYVLADIQSSTSVSKAPSDPCLPTGLSSASVLLQVAVVDPKTSAQSRVSYVDNVVGAQHQLHRAVCQGASSVAADSTLLAQHIATTGGFVVLCDGSPTCPATPKVVNVAVVAESLEPDDESSYGAFEFEFTVTRRVGS